MRTVPSFEVAWETLKRSMESPLTRVRIDVASMILGKKLFREITDVWMAHGRKTAPRATMRD